MQGLKRIVLPTLEITEVMQCANLSAIQVGRGAAQHSTAQCHAGAMLVHGAAHAPAGATALAPPLQTRIKLSTETTDLSIWGGLGLYFHSSFWPNFNTEASLKVTSRKARVTMLVTTNAGLIPCEAVAG